jgi:DNA repair protein RecN (Recombination protein N)
LLEKLYIKNYLIIKEAELNFKKGLNIITGETGAGKTIILDALGILLGDRGNYSIIKNEDEKMVVEGVFNLCGYGKAERFLKENNLTGENNNGYVIIRRELFKKGISRIFVNDTPVNIGLLKDFGDIIIDIHSQNEHQSLLRKETHLDFLDSYAGENRELDEYGEKFDTHKKRITAYETLKAKKDSLLEKKSFIEFQLKEINNINPRPGEDEELENGLKKLENAELINEALGNIQSILYEKEDNVLSALSAAIKEIKRISLFDKALEQNRSALEEAALHIKNITEELRSVSGNIDFDKETTEQTRQRLSSLTFLKKKHGMPLNEIIQKAEDLEAELNLCENFDFELEKLEKEIKQNLEELFFLSEKITAKRKASAALLEKNVNKYLQVTGLENAAFKVKIENYAKEENTGFTYQHKTKPTKLTKSGKDNIEFFVQINKGDDFTSLRKSASGGEISRIMLSLKASISGKDSIPVLVFDEIDAGISGKTANKVGKLMLKLAAEHQVIAITHLPQIAAASENHLKVSKKETDKSTQAQINRLGEEEKITEIAKLLSGEKVTEAAMRAAKELINQVSRN